MRIFKGAFLWWVFVFTASGIAGAGVIRVIPVTLEPAGATGTISLRNEGPQPATVQIRVFRWRQDAAGRDLLESTTDVVASPPAATLTPGANYVVRVVRVATAPPRGEEAYRLLIDELPTTSRPPPGRVALLVRQSVPVFFVGADATRAQVEWSAVTTASGLEIRATNTGGSRQKIENMTVTDGAGRRISERKGLVGYVLGGASRAWVLPPVQNMSPGSHVVLSAASDNHRINVRIPVRRSN